MKEALTPIQEGDNVYLQGTFIEFNLPDRAGRIMTKENFLEQFDYLNDKIDKGYLFGELEHPTRFDVSLENVSHSTEALIIEDNKLIGRFKILETKKGYELLDKINNGIPVYSSYRAYGNSDNYKILTFDIVTEDEQ